MYECFSWGQFKNHDLLTATEHDITFSESIMNRTWQSTFPNAMVCPLSLLDTPSSIFDLVPKHQVNMSFSGYDMTNHPCGTFSIIARFLNVLSLPLQIGYWSSCYYLANVTILKVAFSNLEKYSCGIYFKLVIPQLNLCSAHSKLGKRQS